LTRPQSSHAAIHAFQFDSKAHKIMRTMISIPRLLVALLLPFAMPASCRGGPSLPPLRGGDLPFAVSTEAIFNEPWAMTFLPGTQPGMANAALVTEKKGRLLLWDLASKRSVAISGVPKPAYGGQGGLGDVATHPDFVRNQLIYLSWVEAGKGGLRGAVVGRAKLDRTNPQAPALVDLQIVWRQAPKVSGGGHFGHRIAFGPDGMLYISSGERQKFDPAQDKSANLGKIVRLTPEGQSLPTNPFFVDGGPTAQIWSLGHRNPLGLAFDAKGRLWEIEMGPQGGDELNLITRGANYGWPMVSNGTHYDGRDIPDHAAGDGFESPKAWWNPSISPGSLLIYSGSLFPKWTGSAFVGALGGQALIRLELSGDSARKADAWDMENRIREVEQGPDGAIWLLEDGTDGRLLKLTPKI
jgi:aldose sugar dehydrogenase